jgi:PAS domain S-box-containing protein/putative nucleotidyltransferase with HDIG domain
MNSKSNRESFQKAAPDEVSLITLRAILLTAALVEMSFGVVMFFTGSRIMSIFLLLFGLGTYVIYRNMRLRLWQFVSLLIIISIEALTIYSLIDGSGLRDVSIVAFASLILASGFLFGRSGTIFSSAITMVTILVVGYLQINEILNFGLSTDWGNVIYLLGLYGGFAIIFELLIRQYVDHYLKAKTAEIEIQKSENKYRLLFEDANDGIFIIQNNRFTDCNTKILEMFRAERKYILGKSPHELSPDFQSNGKRTALMEQEMLQAALGGERQVFEWRHLRKDSTEFDAEVSLNLLELENEQFIQAIVRDVTERKQAEKKLAEAYDTTLEGWAKALELRDKETKDHSQRVVELTLILAQAMGFEVDDLSHIRRGSILHDIGKMGIPDEILLKPGKLTPSERKIIEQHPIYSIELLSSIPYLETAMDIPYCHHERWDGTGYPQGLKGEEIPLTARIFAVVDVWDALQSNRPYSKAWSREDVMAHIRNESGKHFDPEVVKVFFNLIEKDEI